MKASDVIRLLIRVVALALWADTLMSAFQPGGIFQAMTLDANGATGLVMTSLLLAAALFFGSERPIIMVLRWCGVGERAIVRQVALLSVLLTAMYWLDGSTYVWLRNETIQGLAYSHTMAPSYSLSILPATLWSALLFWCPCTAWARRLQFSAAGQTDWPGGEPHLPVPQVCRILWRVATLSVLFRSISPVQEVSLWYRLQPVAHSAPDLAEYHRFFLCQIVWITSQRGLSLGLLATERTHALRILCPGGTQTQGEWLVLCGGIGLLMVFPGALEWAHLICEYGACIAQGFPWRVIFLTVIANAHTFVVPIARCCLGFILISVPWAVLAFLLPFVRRRSLRSPTGTVAH